MGTKPIRVPEDSYEEVREIAAKLDVPMSNAANLVIQSGLEDFRLRDHLSLDPDLEQELGEALLKADSEAEIRDTDREVYQRQVDRNRERSDLEIDAT